MYSVDKSNFKKILLNFYKQIEESETIIDQTQINIQAKKVKRISFSYN